MYRWIGLSFISLFFLMIISFTIIKYNKKTKNKKIKENYNFIRSNLIENYLNESGVNYDFFIALNIIIISVFMFFVIINFVNFEFGVANKYLSIMFVALFIIHINIYRKKAKFRKAILKDLISTHHVMYWQSKINTEDEKSITYALQKLKSPLKQELVELAGCYRLKRNVLKKLEEMRKLSKLEELQIFTHMLEQKFKTGMTEEYHRTSLEMLKSLRIKEHKLKKLKNMQEIIIYMVILAILFSVIIAGPILMDSFFQFERTLIY